MTKFRFSGRLAIVGAIGVILTSLVLFHSYRLTSGYQLYLHEKQLLRQMADKRPVGVSEAEWERMVGWTLNLHSYCNYRRIGFPFRFYKAYVNELDQRLAAEKLDVADIDWIWSVYPRLNPASIGFVQQHLPTTSQARQSAYRGEFGIDVK